LVATLSITGSLESHAIEAIKLELRHLAESCGLDVTSVDVRTVPSR
jgi:hypothetical protein